MGNGRNPFEQGDKTEKKPDATPPALNFTDIMKPGEKPAEKPVTTAPERTSGEGPPPPLTQDNLRAEMVAGLALKRFMELSENGAKPVSENDFKIVKEGFEKALASAKINPRTLQLLEAQAQAELTKVVPENKQSDTLARVMVVTEALNDALKALPQDKQKTFFELQQKAEAEAKQLQTRLGHNQALFQQELAKLADKLHKDQSALSPELGKAMKEQKEFGETKEGQAAAQFLQTMEDIDRLRNSGGMIAFTYAQVLEKMGGEANKKLATEQLTEAIKSPKVAAAIESSPQGLDLATKLGVKTPNMIKAEQEAAKVFPELVPFQKAQEILVDEKKDAKTRFTEAKKYMEEALAMTDREGADARKVEDLRKEATELETKLKNAQKEIELGARKDFTDQEKKDLDRLRVVTEQANNVSMIRMQYGLMLNKYGHENNDEEAKKRAIEVLKDIEVVDKDLFLQSPEIQGALRQAQQGKKIELSSAVSEAYTGSALATLANSNSGSVVDFLLPGVQPGLTTALRPLGTTPSEIPLAGPVLFGDRKKPEEAVVKQLAQAYLSNPEATKRAIDQQVQAGRSGVWEYTTDGAAVAAGWLTKYGVQRALTRAPGWGKVAGLGLGLVTAGATKDYLADGEMGTGTDWLRGSGMFGGSVLLMRGLNMNPSRTALTEGTALGVEKRLGLEGLSAARTGGQLSETVFAANAGGSRWYRAAQYFNPSTYTGFTWGGRYVGFGGERTAAALADGTLSFAGYNARRAIGSAANTFGMAYAFGAGREGLYIGTGQKMADGTPYTLEGALAHMNSSGLQAGMTATLVMPIAGSTFRWIPGGSKVLDGTAGLATRLAPEAAPQIGRFALLASGPGMQQVDNFNNANRLKDLSDRAQKMADEAKQKAEEDLRKRMEAARKK